MAFSGRDLEPPFPLRQTKSAGSLDNAQRCKSFRGRKGGCHTYPNARLHRIAGNESASRERVLRESWADDAEPPAAWQYGASDHRAL